MVELIVVMVLVGILAVVAIPKLVSIQTYDTVGFADRVMSALRFAQKQAIAKRRNVCVSFTASTVSFTYAAAAGSGVSCTLNLTGPAGQNPYTIAPERSGVAFSAVPAGFGFSALGRTIDTGTFAALTTAQVITVTGDGSTTIRVEPETGYVHT